MKRQIVLLTVAAVVAAAGAALAADETAAKTQRPRVEITTSMGSVLVELFDDKAPLSVKNFLDYVDQGFYDGTIFHRVIPRFMVQGGGFDPDLQLRPPAGAIPNEADNGLSNKRGTIAMARRNPPHSATSQFFINHADNAGLDHRGKYDGATWGYAVFGQVIEGMDVVDAIAAVPTGPGPRGMRDVPREPVLIESVVRIEPGGEDASATGEDGG